MANFSNKTQTKRLAAGKNPQIQKANTKPLADTNPKKWLIGICKPVGGDLCRWYRHDYYPSKRKAKNALETLLATDSEILAYIILKDGKSNATAEKLYQYLTH